MVFKKILKYVALLVFIYSMSIYMYSYFYKDKLNTIMLNPNNMCINTKVSFFIFKFSNRNIIVKDTNRFIKKIYINKKELKNLYLECDKNIKRFIFTEGAILKTDTDSIDIENNYEKVHGYMGVFIKNDCYYVNKNGTFDICKENKNRGLKIGF